MANFVVGLGEEIFEDENFRKLQNNLQLGVLGQEQIHFTLMSRNNEIPALSRYFFCRWQIWGDTHLNGARAD